MVAKLEAVGFSSARLARIVMLPLVAVALAALAAPAHAQPQTLGELYRKASPAVVVIRAKGTQVTSSGAVGFGEVGSGALISRDGRVVTASHVVHGMEDITVEFVGK